MSHTEVEEFTLTDTGLLQTNKKNWRGIFATRTQDVRFCQQRICRAVGVIKMLLCFIRFFRNRHKKAHHHRTSHKSQSGDAHGGRSDRTANAFTLYRVSFGCFLFIAAKIFCRCRSPPAPLKIILIIFDFRRCPMANKIYFNFFLCGGCFSTNFCVHYAKGKKHTDFLDGKEVKK